MDHWTAEIEREERVYPPVHPGEMLREEWLAPLNMSANQLAKALGVNRQSVYEIVNEKRRISAEMALSSPAGLECALVSGLGFRSTTT